MWIEYHYNGSKKYTTKQSYDCNLNFALNFCNKTGNVGLTNNEAHSCNHCCSGKAISITQPEWVFVALGIQHTTCMCHIVICGLPHSAIFFHNISQMARFSKQSNWTSNVCFNFLYNFHWNIFRSKENWARYDKKRTLVFL